MEQNHNWWAAPEAAQAAWRRWKRANGGGGDRTSDAFVAGWHAATAHRDAAVADRLAGIEALLTEMVAGVHK